MRGLVLAVVVASICGFAGLGCDGHQLEADPTDAEASAALKSPESELAYRLGGTLNKLTRFLSPTFDRSHLTAFFEFPFYTPDYSVPLDRWIAEMDGLLGNAQGPVMGLVRSAGLARGAWLNDSQLLGYDMSNPRQRVLAAIHAAIRQAIPVDLAGSVRVEPLGFLRDEATVARVFSALQLDNGTAEERELPGDILLPVIRQGLQLYADALERGANDVVRRALTMEHPAWPRRRVGAGESAG